MTLAERVKKLRIDMGMSQQELAKRMGYSSRLFDAYLLLQKI